MDPMKLYLIASLVNGITIEYNAANLMSGLVNFINENTEGLFFAFGDEDGVIIEDINSEPFLTIIYTKETLKFTQLGMFDSEPSDLSDGIPKVILNVIAYLRSLNTSFHPVGLSGKEETKLIPVEDWSL